jgi:hypothetical protein
MMGPDDPNSASSAAVTRPSRADVATFDSSYRLLMGRGLTSVEAGNLVAYAAGLHPAEGGWTVEEIENLVAIRSLVAAGLIDS